MIVPDPTEFDWDLSKYASHYSGYSKLSRISLAYSRAPSALKNDWKELLICTFIESSCTSLSKKLRSEGCLEENLLIDWEATIDSKMQGDLNVLESDLINAKSSTNKENIRTAFYNLGSLYYRWGRFEESCKMFLKAREFCSLPRHHNEIDILLISCSIEMGQFLNASGFATKLSDGAVDQITQIRAKAILAVLQLREKNYQQTAAMLLEIDADISNDYNFVISGADIGFYATICSLATMDRTGLRENLLENKKFQHIYLTSNPELKGPVSDILSNSFREFIPFLQWLRMRLQMDIHLRFCAEELIFLIRDRLFLQFMTPYRVIELSKITQAFSIDPGQVRSQLIHLVSTKKLVARIDFSIGVITKKSSENMDESIERALKILQTHKGLFKRALILLSFKKHNFCVDQSNAVKAAVKSVRGEFPREKRQVSRQHPEFSDPEERDEDLMDEQTID